jgi:hypothetical protein
MRVVENEEEFESQMKAISEAINAFGDGAFLLRNTWSPRHIEIQIMADSHGISCIYSKENAAYNVAIKSHEEAPSCFNTRITKKNGGCRIGRLVIILVQEQLSFIRRKYFFFSRNEYPFTGGTSCDGMDYWTGFSRITNQGS